MLVLRRGDHHRHPPTVHGWNALHLHGFAQFLDDLVEGFDGPFPVNSLPTPKEHGELDLVPFLEKAAGAIQLDAPIVLVGLGAKADFLQNDYVSTGCSLLPFLPLILVLAVIHDTADRRFFHRRDFNKVKPRITRKAQRFFHWDDTELRLILVYHPDR